MPQLLSSLVVVILVVLAGGVIVLALRDRRGINVRKALPIVLMMALLLGGFGFLAYFERTNVASTSDLLIPMRAGDLCSLNGSLPVAGADLRLQRIERLHYTAVSCAAIDAPIGSELQYWVRLVNNGNETLKRLVITEQLSTGVTYSRGSGSMVVAGQRKNLQDDWISTSADALELAPGEILDLEWSASVNGDVTPGALLSSKSSISASEFPTPISFTVETTALEPQEGPSLVPTVEAPETEQIAPDPPVGSPEADSREVSSSDAWHVRPAGHVEERREWPLLQT